MAATPFRDAHARFEAGRQGMALFLLSLAVLFIATLIGYLTLRIQLDWPGDLPALPRVLLLSTLVLALSSAALHKGLLAIRAGEQRTLAAMMALTCTLGLIFLGMQALAWGGWLAGIADRWDDSAVHRWALSSFYVLTGVHALHVIGGIVPMMLVTFNAWRGRYSAQRHAGVYYCAMYWHFLGVVWVVLYGTLLIAT